MFDNRLKILYISSMRKTTYLDRDVRNCFPDISRWLTMSYSSGSVEVQMGRYVTESDVRSLEEKFKHYSFV
jgi:hypothetical protein